MIHTWLKESGWVETHAATLQDDWTHVGRFEMSCCQINGLHLRHSSQWCHVSIMKSSLLPSLLMFIVSAPFPCKWGCKYKQTLSNTQLIRQIKWPVLVWLFNKPYLINLIHAGVNTSVGLLMLFMPLQLCFYWSWAALQLFWRDKNQQIGLKLNIPCYIHLF